MTRTPETRPGKADGDRPQDGRPQDGRSGGEARHDYVRPAGPKEMEDKPKTWDIVDEEGDESFPASDPPSNY